jgi:hypothetical protein
LDWAELPSVLGQGVGVLLAVPLPKQVPALHLGVCVGARDMKPRSPGWFSRTQAPIALKIWRG